MQSYNPRRALIKYLVLLFIAAMIEVILVSPAVAQESAPEGDDFEIAVSDSGQKYVPGEVVVFKKNGNVKVRKVQERKLGEIKDKAKKVKASDPSAKFVTPNTVSSIQDIPNDPQWSEQHNLRGANFQDAWNHRQGAPRICVVDTGWDRSHPDLNNAVIAERDLVADPHDSIAQDPNGHGTHVAGIAAAESDNGFGIAGSAWGGLLAIARAGDRGGNFTVANVSQALNWCNNVAGVSVVNLSIGGGAYNAGIEDKILSLNRSNKTVVAVAGNDYSYLRTYYPASYPGVIGVAAVYNGGGVTSFSNRGNFVDVSAPGVNIISTWNANNLAYLTGTSQAAPHVAGLAAMLYGQGYDRSTVINRIYNRADDVYDPGHDNRTGHGMINAGCSLRVTYC